MKKDVKLKCLSGLVLLVLFFIAIACGPSLPKYLAQVTMIEPKQENAKSEKLIYSDESIEITFSMQSTAILINLSNKTNEAIKIYWDDLAFVSTNNYAKRLIHSGVKLIDKNQAQVATIIPPNSKIIESIITSDSVVFVEKDWVYLSLFPAEDLIDAQKKYVGKEFSIYFPIVIKGKAKEYNFKFKILGMKQE